MGARNNQTKKPSGKKEHELFVGISQPLAVRREILHEVKELLQVLKFYHEYLALHEKKKTTLEQFHAVMGAITELYEQLSQLLPLEALPKEHHPRTPVAAQKAKPSSKHKSELDALEEELKKVEEAIKKFT